MDLLALASLALEGVKLMRQYQEEGKLSEADAEQAVALYLDMHERAMAGYNAGRSAWQTAKRAKAGK